MSFEIKLNLDNKNENLHSDIILVFPNICKKEVVDSYYLFGGSKESFQKGSYFEDLGLKLIDKLENWVDQIDAGRISSDNLLALDISDEYLGALRIKFVNKVSLDLTYGLIKNPIPFPITDIITEYPENLFNKLYDVGSQVSLLEFRETIKKSTELITNQLYNVGSGSN